MGNELDAKVRILEKQVDFLLRVNGYDLSRIKESTNPELRALYREVVGLIPDIENHYDPDVFECWAQKFNAISEMEFIRLRNIVGYDHPWQPFYLLCSRMMSVLRDQDDLTDVTLRALYAFLARGLTNLRDSAVMFLKVFSDSSGEVNAATKALVLGDSPSRYIKRKRTNKITSPWERG